VINVEKLLATIRSQAQSGSAEPEDSPRTMALCLAGLFAAGATTGALTLVLPHPMEFDESALWSNVALAYLGAIVLAMLAGRLPVWSIQIAVVIGTLVVTRAVYFGDDPSGFYSLWYLWVGLYAFFFFGRFWGFVHTGLVGATYAWALWQISSSVPVARWAMTVGTLIVAGILIDVLASRVRRRAAEADSRAAALAAVSEVAHDLARDGSTDDVRKTICSSAVRIAGSAGAALSEPAPNGRGLVITAATNPEAKGEVLPFLSRPSGTVRAFTSGEPFFLPDARGREEVNQVLVERFGVIGILFQPIIRDGTPTGVLAVYWDRVVAGLEEDLSRLIGLLAIEGSVAMERTETHARLERVARTDDLTGLPNRRAWHEQLSREIARARRQGTPLAVSILDLDHFKEYNDNHGHLVGDRFLKQASAAWSELIRDTDILARYGGEEFALAMPDTEIEEATAMLDRIREGTPEEERISAGVVVWDGSEEPEELIARADAALYAAKRGGRDRVIPA
jgi:diguanylate cyclase (GGDEF)-like protein